MQPIPIDVTDVTVYPDYGAHGPVELPVLTGAQGTYSVGTLGTSIFYNLDLHGGSPTDHGQLNVGQHYTASCHDGSGEFTTPSMPCLRAGDEPSFGLTVTLGGRHTGEGAANAGAAAVLRADDGPYIDLGPLHDISAITSGRPGIIATLPLFRGGEGSLIATRVGTPHLMGVRVDHADVENMLSVGAHWIDLAAVDENGKAVRMSNLTQKTADFPLILLQTWPPVG